MKKSEANNVSTDPFMFTPALSHVCKDSCLHRVAQVGDSSKFSNFVTSMKRGDGEVNAVDENGRTALHWLNSISESL